MAYRFETFRSDKRIVALQSLQISHLSDIHKKIYELPKLKIWMCELCTFSQIQSQIMKTRKRTAIYILLSRQYPSTNQCTSSSTLILNNWKFQTRKFIIKLLILNSRANPPCFVLKSRESGDCCGVFHFGKGVTI